MGNTQFLTYTMVFEVRFCFLQTLTLRVTPLLGVSHSHIKKDRSTVHKKYSVGIYRSVFKCSGSLKRSWKKLKGTFVKLGK